MLEKAHQWTSTTVSEDLVRTIATGDLECAFLDDYLGDPWVTSPEVILVQHGFNGNLATFQRWVPALAGRFRVIRRALFAHDGTNGGRPDHDLSLEGLANDLVSFLDALGLERVHFLGTHTGAMSGVCLAALHPDRLISLGLLDCPLRTSGLQKLLVRGLSPPGEVFDLERGNKGSWWLPRLVRRNPYGDDGGRHSEVAAGCRGTLR